MLSFSPAFLLACLLACLFRLDWTAPQDAGSASEAAAPGSAHRHARSHKTCLDEIDEWSESHTVRLVGEEVEGEASSGEKRAVSAVGCC